MNIKPAGGMHNPEAYQISTKSNAVKVQISCFLHFSDPS